MLDNKCIFCGHDHAKAVIQEHGHVAVQCDTCGLIYVVPRPTPKEATELYESNSSHLMSQMLIGDEYSNRLHARHLLPMLQRRKTHGRLLDIGAGAGYFLDEARKLGFDPYGVELNPAQVLHMREKLGLPCHEGPFGDDCFEGMSFDIIYHSDALSHIHDPLRLFAMIQKRLMQDGLLLFETGNFGEMHPRYYREIESFQLPDHLFFFTVDNLLELLGRNGLEAIEIHRYSILPQLRARRLFSRMKSLLLPLLANRAAPLDESDAEEPSASKYSPSRSSVSWPRRAYRKAREWAEHHIRYGLGGWMPRKGHPQTVIIMARTAKSA